ncbi:uncharacterized protein LTR77_001794 [Saxophila tyrrhenica]|uniref:Uncharacterized protein n=1 Tax=Saxophila tyrrhenica TaxID=1690608 RepID=A0AAV9PQW7_9PEZI|nr:hypothetical protein LTR77_001794 [Saxophila tyrrhenica]
MAGTKKRKEPDGPGTPQQKKKKWSGRMLSSGKKGNTLTEINSRSRLLSLPAEIRNRIWSYALCEESLHIHQHPENGRRSPKISAYSDARRYFLDRLPVSGKFDSTETSVLTMSRDWYPEEKVYKCEQMPALSAELEAKLLGREVVEDEEDDDDQKEEGE